MPPFGRRLAGGGKPPACISIRVPRSEVPLCYRMVLTRPERETLVSRLVRGSHEAVAPREVVNGCDPAAAKRDSRGWARESGGNRPESVGTLAFADRFVRIRGHSACLRAGPPRGHVHLLLDTGSLVAHITC